MSWCVLLLVPPGSRRGLPSAQTEPSQRPHIHCFNKHNCYMWLGLASWMWNLCDRSAPRRPAPRRPPPARNGLKLFRMRLCCFPLHKITFKPLRYSFYQECRTCISIFFSFFFYIYPKKTALELRVTQQTWRYLNMKRCHNICNISHYRKSKIKKTCLYLISYKKVMEKFLKIGRNLCQIHVKCIKNTKPQHLTVKDALRLGIFK